ncbi:MAG: RNA polymerase sigma factor [Acidobacteria bacterium]|nr:RNA polymerase sigma factor [Acidobacteriota bacterium]
MERHPSSALPGGPLSNPPSGELLNRARAGDERALDRLFARYVPRLHRWAHRRVPVWARSAADTADYVQETVLHTLRHLGTFEPQREGALLGYLRRSLVNRMRDQFRHAARHPAPGELNEGIEDGGRSPLDQAIGEEDRQRYEDGLKRLRSADRRAIVASIELGYSYEQIALVLNKPSAEAARVAVRRALVRLGEEMNRGS